MSKKNPSFPAGKQRGRTDRTTPDQFKPTKPELGVTRKAEANRAGPGQKGSHKSRGDRRDMGPTSY